MKNLEEMKNEEKTDVRNGAVDAGLTVETLKGYDARAEEFIAGLVAAAEERGYLKGLNEVADRRLNAPALNELLPPEPPPEEEPRDRTLDFFAAPRRSVWD